MELSAAVVGLYLGWTVLAMFPRRVVRPSYRLAQDPLVLTLTSLLLNLVCCDVVASLVLAYVAFVMYHDLPSTRMAVAGKAVFVTGCDQGLGHTLALQLDEMGFKVYAGCLYKGGPGEQRLVESASSRLTTLQVDVTSRTQLEQAARVVVDDLQGKALHGVVNNAGILMAGNMEVMSEPDIRKIVEVNYLGLVNVYRAFMPLLREPRRDRARLVNVASNMGIAPACQLGAYVSSKAAVMMLNETWRYELKPMGVDVCTIIPSGFRTGIQAYDRNAAADRWWAEATDDVRRYFGRECFEPTDKFKNARELLNADFRPVTSCMVDALLARKPRTIYYKGLMARSLPFLYIHLPSVLWDRLMPLLADYLTFPVKALRTQNINNNNSDHIKSSTSSSGGSGGGSSLPKGSIVGVSKME